MNGGENFWINISSTVDQIIADLMEDDFQEEFQDNLMEELELIGQEVGKPLPQPTLSSIPSTPPKLWGRPHSRILSRRGYVFVRGGRVERCRHVTMCC